MGKVAIVGVEGSGKTVLMGALCECYRQGTADVPYLMPENQAAFMFMERIPHKLRVEREWPEATSVSSLRSMRWTLRLGTEVLEEIELLDYPGELYRIAFGERDLADVAQAGGIEPDPGAGFRAPEPALDRQALAGHFGKLEARCRFGVGRNEPERSRPDARRRPRIDFHS